MDGNPPLYAVSGLHPSLECSEDIEHSARGFRSTGPSGRVAAARRSLRSLFTGEANDQQIQNGEHDACDHNHVKMTALFYGFDQSRRVF